MILVGREVQGSHSSEWGGDPGDYFDYLLFKCS